MRGALLRDTFLRNRRWLAEVIEAVLVSAALAASFLLRFEFSLEPPYARMLAAAVPLAVAAKLAVFRAFDLRDVSWRYVGFQDLQRIAYASAAGSCAWALLARAAIGAALPRSIYVIDLLASTALLVGAHAAGRLYFAARRSPAEPSRQRVAIYGAGQAGVTLLKEIRSNPQIGFEVTAFFDDDPFKRGLRVDGVKVLGGRAGLARAAARQRIAMVLIALPAATGGELTSILEECHRAGVPAKRVPALAELMRHRVLVDQIRDVRIEDLLGRAPAQLSEDEIRRRLRGRVVLVTGAGGSIGGELCRQIARFGPRALVGFDHSETALYEIARQLQALYPSLTFCPEVGSLQNRRRLEEVFRERAPEAVYHAAAYKHVPMMEAHLFEAVENNVFGTRNLLAKALEYGVEHVVLISSDKAVRPANVMGATKRLAEMICQAAAFSGAGSTRLMAVRFGNVLGSSGSVVPLFKEQIAAGGPVTVTHPEMRRYFMTIPEAAQLVLQAAAMGSGGEIFVLEMGEPVRILDLARKMVLLSGLQPGEDIEITFCGIRPGEKLGEELSAYQEDTRPTPHSQIRVLSGPGNDAQVLHRGLDRLRAAVEASDAPAALLCLQELAPEYHPSSFLLRRSQEESNSKQLAFAAGQAAAPR
jgi:FlaA1/EpsC-like NDP-sugar epimerase